MYTEKRFFLGYAIVMSVNRKRSYVFDKDDIENGGMQELDKSRLIPPDKSHEMLYRLRAYCKNNGYENAVLWLVGIEDDNEVENVELLKGGYNQGDTLIWTYADKDYSCTGEFYVDKDNNLHHTFIAPSGKEIEIVTPYETT